MAGLVIEGQLTLGAMLAIQYIIGQLNSPVEQLVVLTQHYQDARIALERLDEIQRVAEEESPRNSYCSSLPADKSLSIRDLSFSYPGAGATTVLRDICLRIPERKITAIVGSSGSGKTTLLKVLLQIYDSYTGTVLVGGAAGESPADGIPSLHDFHHRDVPGTDLRDFSPSFWRACCGSVMQDGFLFNDSIRRNIAVGEERADPQRLMMACRVARILPFVESLPLGFDTKVGADGNGISQGQKQRILIARAVYRDPEFLFFDEATNALDANNERLIVESLNEFFRGRTVVIVAHRLSTVMRADNIVVLEDGRIVEEGRHEQLARNKGYYYELVKNQLALGV